MSKKQLTPAQVEAHAKWAAVARKVSKKLIKAEEQRQKEKN